MIAKNFIIAMLFSFSSSTYSESSLDIPDINAIKRSLDKQVSGNTDEYCASCTQHEKKRSPRTTIFANFEKMGGDKTALTQALCFFDKNKDKKFQAKGDPARSSISIENERYITILDLTKKSTEARLFIIDTQTGEVQTTFSSHGGGQTYADSARNLFTAVDISNTSGSNFTPRGFFITGNTYSSKWPVAMRLYGLQKGINDNSFTRAVVIHSYPKFWTEDRIFSSNEELPADIISDGPMVLSWGCTMLSPKLATGIISKLKATESGKGGSLYYNFSNVEKDQGESYCGENNLYKSSK